MIEFGVREATMAFVLVVMAYGVYVGITERAKLFPWWFNKEYKELMKWAKEQQ